MLDVFLLDYYCKFLPGIMVLIRINVTMCQFIFLCASFLGPCNCYEMYFNILIQEDMTNKIIFEVADIEYQPFELFIFSIQNCSITVNGDGVGLCT